MTTTGKRFGLADAYSEGWLSRCHPTQQKRWASVLRAMTEAEIKEFHAYRLERASRFFSDDTTPGGRNERDEAEMFLLRHWRARLGARVLVPEAA